MRDFDLTVFYVPTVCGLPFVIKQEDSGRNVQPVFDSDLRARNFMTDPVVKPLVEALIPGGTFGVLRVDIVVQFCAVIFDNKLRLFVNPVAINEHRVDYNEVVLRDGKLYYLEAGESSGTP